MLRILIADKEVDVDENIAIQVRYENPMFDEDRINRGVSYSFTLPAAPTINSIYKNRNRVNESVAIIRESIKIYHSDILFFNGVIEFSTKGTTAYNCYCYNEALDFLKTAKSQQLSTTPMDTYDLWTVAENATLTWTEKLQRWADFMENVNEESTYGFTFPMLIGHYNSYEGAVTYDDVDNWLFEEGRGSVNGRIKGNQVQNSINSNAAPFPMKNWHHTVSPCLKADYILKRVLDVLGIEINRNQLESILEYQQMVEFSCKVKDEWVTDGVNNTNIHGRQLKLSEFVPDVTKWEIFKLLIESFNAYFIVDEFGLYIDNIENMLSITPIDMTRFSSPDFDKEQLELISATIQYDLSEDQQLMYNTANVLERFDYNEFNSPGREAFNITFNHLPLMSGVQSGTIFIITADEYNQLAEDLSGYWAWCNYSWLRNNLGNTQALDKNQWLILVSDEFPDSGNKLPTRFYTLLFRGKYNLPYYTDAQIIAEEFFDPPAGSAEMFIGTNYSSTLKWSEFFGAYIPSYVFSANHNYISEIENDLGKSIHENYYQRYLDLINGAAEITKMLYLAPHQVKELGRFQKPIHYIESDAGKFEGVVKEFTVTLYKDKISPTQVTYVKEQFNTSNL